MSPACTGRRIVRPGVGDAAGDRLADPPRGVRRELEALAPVELLDRVHEAEVALLDQVEQRQARRLVLLGDRHDEAQVRLHERALRRRRPDAAARRSSRFLAGVSALPPPSSSLARRVALLDLLREADLVVLGEQRVLPDVGEIEPDEIFFVALDTLLRHAVTPWLVGAPAARSGPRTGCVHAVHGCCCCCPFTIPAPSSGSKGTAESRLSCERTGRGPPGRRSRGRGGRGRGPA